MPLMPSAWLPDGQEQNRNAFEGEESDVNARMQNCLVKLCAGL